MSVEVLLGALEPEVEEPEEESFLLFSQSIPSQNLGFVDSKATVLELTIGGRDLSIHQSPKILTSNRRGGTTGAVVWRITPLFASWVALPSGLLLKHNVVNSNAIVLELGCGISGIIGLSLALHIHSYVLTDQEYVMKILNQNLSNNRPDTPSSAKGRKSASKPKRGSALSSQANGISNIITKPLDWETDEVNASLTGSTEHKSFDVIIACDCIYNDALIDPLVQTCIDVCKLRLADTDKEKPTVCIVAQQLRSAEVFEAWLKAFYKAFRVWRVPDAELTDGLRIDSGFVVHMGILRQ